MKTNLISGIAIILLCLLSSASAQAQTEPMPTEQRKFCLGPTEKSGPKLGLYLNVGGNWSYRQHGVLPVTADIDLGISFFPRTYLFISSVTGVGLDNSNGGNRYFGCQNLGGGLGWRFFVSKDGNDALDLKGRITTRIAGSWKNTSYEVGLHWRFCNKLPISPVLGVGYRYVHSNAMGIPNLSTLMLSAGFSF